MVCQEKSTITILILIVDRSWVFRAPGGAIGIESYDQSLDNAPSLRHVQPLPLHLAGRRSDLWVVLHPDRSKREKESMCNDPQAGAGNA